MDTLLITQVSLSVLALVLSALISFGANHYARRVQQRKSLAKSRYYLIRRIISFCVVILALSMIILIWGIDLKNLWVSVTGVLAMIAVAFFAVWSLVGNMLAGVLIFFTSPFKINDLIEIMPEGISGKVIAINTFFTLLVDSEGNHINIPNSLFFQKYIKQIRHPRKSEDKGRVDEAHPEKA